MSATKLDIFVKYVNTSDAITDELNKQNSVLNFITTDVNRDVNNSNVVYIVGIGSPVPENSDGKIICCLTNISNTGQSVNLNPKFYWPAFAGSADRVNYYKNLAEQFKRKLQQWAYLNQFRSDSMSLASILQIKGSGTGTRTGIDSLLCKVRGGTGADSDSEFIQELSDVTFVCYDESKPKVAEKEEKESWTLRYKQVGSLQELKLWYDVSNTDVSANVVYIAIVNTTTLDDIRNWTLTLMSSTNFTVVYDFPPSPLERGKKNRVEDLLKIGVEQLANQMWFKRINRSAPVVASTRELIENLTTQMVQLDFVNKLLQ